MRDNQSSENENILSNIIESEKYISDIVKFNNNDGELSSSSSSSSLSSSYATNNKKKYSKMK